MSLPPFKGTFFFVDRRHGPGLPIAPVMLMVQHQPQCLAIRASWTCPLAPAGQRARARPTRADASHGHPELRLWPRVVRIGSTTTAKADDAGSAARSVLQDRRTTRYTTRWDEIPVLRV